jgi:hypothetical protein
MRDEIQKTTVRTPLPLHKAAKIKAIREGTNISEVIRAFLYLWVKGEVPTPRVANERIASYSMSGETEEEKVSDNE